MTSQSQENSAKFNMINIKIFSLIILVIQSTLAVILMRYSRTVEGPLYLASTVVIMVEVLKLVACFHFILLTEVSNVPFPQRYIEAIKYIIYSIFYDRGELLKMLVPSALYAIQNNLVFLAIGHLDVMIFQITYQLKILTTALFAVVLLKKRLSFLKWFALVLLMLGVILVQWKNCDSKNEPSMNTQKQSSNGHQQNPVIGLLAILVASFSSGFSGVYFEMILKFVGSSKETDIKKSLWMRNIQLGLFGLLFSILASFSDYKSISQNGFFYGYNSLTLAIIFLQAVGGLTIAVVMKYADNILKGFATSVSLIISTLFTLYTTGIIPEIELLTGALLVMISIYLYSLPDEPVPKHQYLPVAHMEKL